MIRKLVRLYHDFMDFLMIRKLTDTMELTEKDKVILRWYDKDFEKRIENIMLQRLAKEMLAGATSQDIYRWAHLAITWRLAILWNLKKDN